jgi:hypothetical protein
MEFVFTVVTSAAKTRIEGKWMKRWIVLVAILYGLMLGAFFLFGARWRRLHPEFEPIGRRARSLLTPGDANIIVLG